VFLLLFLLLFRNCSFRSPQEPTFIVDWFLPLVEHTWTMSELTDDVKELEVDANPIACSSPIATI
jgi:hypothetical protein